jgi:EAL domain-containing protein (putative c-di-GMP-specific phosphodiesterase class I)
VFAEDPTAPGWVLAGCLSSDAPFTHVPLTRFPFVVGRDPACDLQVMSRNVSKRHAEILHTTHMALVRDLGSTNGTFVNGNRIHAPTPVGEYDLIQFADIEMRLCRETHEVSEKTYEAESPEQFWEISRICKVLNEGQIGIAFQPIITGPGRRTYGYEALVRAEVPGLESPIALFASATKLGVEKRLSDLCRVVALRTIEDSGVPGTLFLNTHPNEPLDETMIESMRALRAESEWRPLVLEVHEKAVGEINAFCQFKKELHRLGILLAFDDFGVGQSRLLELAKVRPDFIKFDRELVKDLGSPSATQSGIVSSLHKHAVSLGIATLAEGLETPESIAACDAIGFDYYQGYAFGRPQKIAHFTGPV